MPVFFFSDIEGSTQKWEKFKEKMSQALQRHDEILVSTIQKYGGSIIKHTGDGIFAAFEAGNPLQGAVDIQKGIENVDWGDIGELRVRIALHAGYAEKRKDDYFGPVINRTARILGAAWGGQILLTQAVLNTSPLPAGAKTEDLGEHILKDLGEPQHIYCLFSPELKLHEFPPLRSLSAHVHNLPFQATPFLGREEELAELENLLKMPDPGCRLITIIGPGGIGKTRLALQSAADMIEHFPNGVFLIPLAPLSSTQLLVTMIADQIKFSFYSNQEPKAQLLNYLSEKQMLLVMDNFEHIIDGAGLITEILAKAPRVKILVTSREMLNLQGEWLLQIEGLKYPEGERIDIGEYSAVQLFLQSARRIKTDFQPTEEDIRFLVRICQLVGGLPLGIELASAWLRVLSLIEITKEIEKNLDFLTTSMRNVPSRHRSLRAVFEYSWALLNDQEKRILSRLSVFPRKFSRAAAEKIAGASLQFLSSLIDKSLLRKDPSGYYEIVVILKQYAEEKLKEHTQEQAKTRDLFLDFYADYLHNKISELDSSERASALSEIGNEIDNIRAAWAQIIEKADEKLLEKTVSGVYMVYDIYGWFKEGAEDFDRIIEYLERAGETSLLGTVLARKAMFLYHIGPFEPAQSLLNRSRQIARRHGSKNELLTCLNTLGNIAYLQSQFDSARDYYNQCLKLAEELDNKNRLAGALNNLGVLSYGLKEYDKAKELFERSLRVSQESKDPKGTAYALSNIALVLHKTGRNEESKKLFEENLEIERELGDKIGMANSLNNLGLVYAELKDYDGAKKVHEQSLKIRQEIGDRIGIATSYLCLAGIAHNAGDYDKTIDFCSRGIAIRKEIGDARGEIDLLVYLGQTYLVKPDYEMAKQNFVQALKFAVKIGYREIYGDALLGLAKFFAQKDKKILAAEITAVVLKNYKKDEELCSDAQQVLDELYPQLTKAEVSKIQKTANTVEIKSYVKKILSPMEEKLKSTKKKK